MFFIQSARRARGEKGIARHIDASSVKYGWGLVIFDWFVLSMRMQVILDSTLDSLFACPGSALIWGGKKGEFRDWNESQMKIIYNLNMTSTRSVHSLAKHKKTINTFVSAELKFSSINFGR